MNERPPLPSIMIADDSPEDRELLELLLREAGVANPVVFAESGAAAISVLENANSDATGSCADKPAVVFLDVNMPPGDGFHVLAWIRKNRALTGVRVLMMTDSDEPRHMKRAEQLKADGYLLKHPHPDVIAFLLRQVMAPRSSEPPAV